MTILKELRLQNVMNYCSKTLNTMKWYCFVKFQAEVASLNNKTDLYYNSQQEMSFSQDHGQHKGAEIMVRVCFFLHVCFSAWFY